MPDSIVYSRFVLGPGASLLVVLLLGFAVAGGLIVVALIRARRATRRAEQVGGRSPWSDPLESGRLLVAGTVQAGEGPVMEVAVEERGREFETAHDWRHLWTERSRRLTGRPFVLALDGGERVVVLADDRSIAIAPFSATRADGLGARTRFAAIGPGMRVWVEGVLRRAPARVADAAAADGGMELAAARPLGRLLVAAVPPERFYRERAAMHRRWASRFTLLFAAIHLLAFGRYWALSVAGRVVDAPILALHAYQTAERTGPVWHWSVSAHWAAPEGPIPLEDDISEAFYESSTAAQAKRTPATAHFRVLRGFPEVQSIGTRPTIDRSTAWEVGILLALAALVYALRAWSTRASHAMPRVVEPGRGRLESAETLAPPA